jgi:nanoRNase/pAp phosphatase (c-di-AMP/oligoRNAs hydrolase)
MRNPWLDFESVPLGTIFKRFGGGGHTRVASVLVPIDEAHKASQMLGEIVDAIHEAESQSRESQGIEA